MPDAAALVALQNSNGAWGFGHHRSWTEPTCYALLALCGAGGTSSEAVRRGVLWLRQNQHPDGGWPPAEGIEESTWVTALPLLLPPGLIQDSRRSQAVRWILDSTGKESSFVHRLRLRLLGVPADPGQNLDGWPWYPGAAAWVVPTALSVLALKHASSLGGDKAVKRAAEGREFLMARRCQDGGWNHGSTHALGYEFGSYPEATGVALLGLHGMDRKRLANSIERAQAQLAVTRSNIAASWLVLGLLAQGAGAHGQVSSNPKGAAEIALSLLAEQAREGRNLFAGGGES